MVAYGRDEIISASDVARNFSKILKDVTSYTKEKIAISKNNKLEAVIVPIEEYERMQEALEMAEHIEIYNTVKARENAPKEKYISLEDSAKLYGINIDEL